MQGCRKSALPGMWASEAPSKNSALSSADRLDLKRDWCDAK